MESRAKLAGHPIHPMLIVFPLGLLIASVIFDVIYFVGRNPSFGTIAFWNIAFGVIGGLLAAIFGLVDWWAIPKRTRAKQIGIYHAGMNVLVLGLFLASWVIRLKEVDRVPTISAFVLSLIAVACGAVSGWLGGELVDRLGVGVDDGANLDAPSSLSGEPARNVVATGANPVGP